MTKRIIEDWQQHNIFTRSDNSFIIIKDGYPYHVPPETEEFTALWAEVDAFARANPAQVMPEPGPPEPSLDEAKAAKRMEIKAGYDVALIATLTMPEAAPSAAETATQAALFAVEDSAGLADVMDILNARRADLNAAVDKAQTVPAVQAVVVSYPV